MEKTNRLCIKCILENKDILECDALELNEQNRCRHRTDKGYCAYPICLDAWIIDNYKNIIMVIDKLGKMEDVQEECKMHELTMCDNCTKIYECKTEVKKEALVNTVLHHKKCDEYKSHAYCCFCGAKLD